MRAAQERAIVGRTLIATTQSEASLARRGIASTDNWGVEQITHILFFFLLKKLCHHPKLAFLNYNLAHPLVLSSYES